MEDLTTNIKPAELVRADTALQSFRDGGYSLIDAIGEIVDNSIQAGARTIRFDWDFDVVRKGKSDKTQREMTSLAICDDGHGIPPTILPNVLTIGFSTRYNNRDGIGRFGVGFKLASISQAKRLEIYSKPAYLVLNSPSSAIKMKPGGSLKATLIWMRSPIIHKKAMAVKKFLIFRKTINT
jgi:DNA topoisomerase VI subunit B